MQLNEIIEGNTLQSISDKTRLSVENLEKLFAQDFGAFRKVQALGFISILEREYRADLSELREACYAYFADGSMQEPSGYPSGSAEQTPGNPSAISEMSMPRQYPSFVKPLLVGLVAIGLLYAAWQTYSNTKGDANASRTGEDVGFFASMIQKATGWIGGGEKNTTALQNGGGHAASATRPEADKETFVIQKTDKTQTQSDAVQVETKGNTRPDKEAQSQSQPVPSTATQEPRLEIDEAIASAPEENGTEAAPFSTEVPSVSHPQTAPTTGDKSPTTTATAGQSVEQTADKPVDEEAARKRAEEEAARQKAAEEKALREREARQKAAEEKAIRERAARERAARERAAREEAARQKAAKLKAARAKIVVLKPRKKVWMGIVDLVNMKRRVATSNAAQTFDTNKGKWIVATGHGFIDYTEGPKKMALNDGKKHFLLIADGKVREISHEEFQQLNKSKVW